MPSSKPSLCRFLQAAHYKSGHWSSAFSNRNFMRERAAAIFVLCRRAGLGRNDVALSPIWFRAIMPPRSDQLMQERHWAMRAILAVVLLCTAFTIFGKAQAEPSAETVARGKAPTQAAGWRAATQPIPQSR